MAPIHLAQRFGDPVLGKLVLFLDAPCAEWQGCSLGCSSLPFGPVH